MVSPETMYSSMRHAQGPIDTRPLVTSRAIAVAASGRTAR